MSPIKLHTMTTLFSDTVVCAVCHEKTYVQNLGSTYSFGSSDLDTRPPLMRRSTMNIWVHACPTCGYCAADLSKASDGTFEVIESEAYQEIRTRVELPANARDFLCQALIAEASGRFDKAAWPTIFVAWLCDDDEASALADHYRLQAAELIQRAEREGQFLGSDSGTNQSVLADLLRRAGKFQEAKEVAQQGLDMELSETVEQVLRFQLHLIELQDRSCRTVAEAVAMFKVELKADPFVRRGTPFEKQRCGDIFAPRPIRKTNHTGLSTALAVDELVRLKSFLASGATPIAAMDIGMLDGYLTALAVGPVVVLPDEILRWVWDTEQGLELPIFDEVHDVQLITSLVLRQYYAISYAINEQAYEPDSDEWDPKNWFRGFFIGITTEYPDWLPLMSSRSDLFESVLRYGTADEDLVLVDAEVDQAFASAVDSVRHLHEVFQGVRLEALSRRGDEGELRRWNRQRAPNKVRRNDPCPCGSKFEFKNCHGKRAV